MTQSAFIRRSTSRVRHDARVPVDGSAPRHGARVLALMCLTIGLASAPLAAAQSTLLSARLANPGSPGNASSGPADGSAGGRGAGLASEAIRVDMSPMERAEAAYRARRYDVALEHFGMVAASEDHPLAWLRIANIWHRQGQVAMAMDAYGRARDAAARLGQQHGLRERAIMNIALLSLDQAQRALDAAGAVVTAPENRRWQAEVQLRLHELLDSLAGTTGGEQQVLSQMESGSAARAPRESGSAARAPRVAATPGR
ncbi:MAG: hypothetical protein R3E83_21480 [Burkholderiaceae bacterium]